MFEYKTYERRVKAQKLPTEVPQTPGNCIPTSSHLPKVYFKRKSKTNHSSFLESTIIAPVISSSNINDNLGITTGVIEKEKVFNGTSSTSLHSSVLLDLNKSIDKLQNVVGSDDPDTAICPHEEAILSSQEWDVDGWVAPSVTTVAEPLTRPSLDFPVISSVPVSQQLSGNSHKEEYCADILSSQVSNIGIDGGVGPSVITVVEQLTEKDKVFNGTNSTSLDSSVLLDLNRSVNKLQNIVDSEDPDSKICRHDEEYFTDIMSFEESNNDVDGLVALSVITVGEPLTRPSLDSFAISSVPVSQQLSRPANVEEYFTNILSSQVSNLGVDGGVGPSFITVSEWLTEKDKVFNGTSNTSLDSRVLLDLNRSVNSKDPDGKIFPHYEEYCTDILSSQESNNDVDGWVAPSVITVAESLTRPSLDFPAISSVPVSQQLSRPSQEEEYCADILSSQVSNISTDGGVGPSVITVAEQLTGPSLDSPPSDSDKIFYPGDRGFSVVTSNTENKVDQGDQLSMQDNDEKPDSSTAFLGTEVPKVETDVKRNPRQKIRRKKHRPKIKVSGTPRRRQKPSIQKPEVSRNPSSERTLAGKRKYVRKNDRKDLPVEDVVIELATPRPAEKSRHIKSPIKNAARELNLQRQHVVRGKYQEQSPREEGFIELTTPERSEKRRKCKEENSVKDSVARALSFSLETKDFPREVEFATPVCPEKINNLKNISNQELSIPNDHPTGLLSSEKGMTTLTATQQYRLQIETDNSLDCNVKEPSLGFCMPCDAGLVSTSNDQLTMAAKMLEDKNACTVNLQNILQRGNCLRWFKKFRSNLPNRCKKKNMGIWGWKVNFYSLNIPMPLENLTEIVCSWVSKRVRSNRKPTFKFVKRKKRSKRHNNRLRNLNNLAIYSRNHYTRRPQDCKYYTLIEGKYETSARQSENLRNPLFSVCISEEFEMIRRQEGCRNSDNMEEKERWKEIVPSLVSLKCDKERFVEIPIEYQSIGSLQYKPLEHEPIFSLEQYELRQGLQHAANSQVYLSHGSCILPSSCTGRGIPHHNHGFHDSYSSSRLHRMNSLKISALVRKLKGLCINDSKGRKRKRSKLEFETSSRLMVLDQRAYDFQVRPGMLVPYLRDLIPTKKSRKEKPNCTFPKTQLMVFNPKIHDPQFNPGTLVPVLKKPKMKIPKVDLDIETKKEWDLLMSMGSTPESIADETRKSWWEGERKVFRGRIDLFINRMHLLQGNRKFKLWKGSVVDSVVGVFLTQNVSDHLSSTSYMTLAAKYPIQYTSDHVAQHKNGEIRNNQETAGCNFWYDNLLCNSDGQQYFVNTPPEPEKSNALEEAIEEMITLELDDSKVIELEKHEAPKCDVSEEAMGEIITVELEELEKHKAAKCNVSEEAMGEINTGELEELEKHKAAKCNVSEEAMREINTGELEESKLIELKKHEAAKSHVPEEAIEETITVELEESKLLELENQEADNSNLLQEICSLSCELDCGYPTLSSDDDLKVAHEPMTPFDSLDPFAVYICSSQMEVDHSSTDCFYTSDKSESTDAKDITSVSTVTQNELLANCCVPQNCSSQEKYYPERNSSACYSHQEEIVNTQPQNTPLDMLECIVDKVLEGQTTKMQPVKDVISISENSPIENMLNKGKSQEATPKRTMKKEEEEEEDWRKLREMHTKEGPRDRNRMDSVDWDAVMRAEFKEVVETIKDRGQQSMIGGRIQKFLKEEFEENNCIDLEWLRNAPPDKVKKYLLRVKGLGLKSVECIRLLSLQNVAFPVDTNVGRIAVRLGWVPLEPLPDELQMHLLEQFPMMDSIQKYLWPRLCTLNQEELYELHYQMITFGKVFCTKLNPNCNACPMKAECKHFASAFASSRFALPGPAEKKKERSMAPIVVVSDPAVAINQTSVNVTEVDSWTETEYLAESYMPVIEMPASPQCENRESLERSTEDEPCQSVVSSKEIPNIEMDIEDFKRNVQDVVYRKSTVVKDIVVAKEILSLTPEAAFLPMPKLKYHNRLRTEHLVYEVPDGHDILKGFEKRECDDPSPYLLAIWTPGETANSFEPPKKECSSEGSDLCNEATCFDCNNIREQNSNMIRGTILIPCRTAMRGRFPLNGTYFQTNEVFADDETSNVPISLRRELLHKLKPRAAYFGTSVTAIFRGLETRQIQLCFWTGFICVRGFDRSGRSPKNLSRRFHCPPSKKVKPKVAVNK